jgi:2-aminoadipate transaminase
MVAPEEVIQRAVKAKQGMDLHTSTFVQMMVYEALKDDFLKQHVRHIREVYSYRRNVMLDALAASFPPGVHWTEPEGGLFLWVTLPETLNATELMPQAIAHKVAYVPGSAFDPDGAAHNTFRLNFSNASPDMIEEGIDRLGRMLTHALALQKPVAA